MPEKKKTVTKQPAQDRWSNFFNEKHQINYKAQTMYQMIKNVARHNPQSVAYEFMGKKVTYTQFIQRIDLTSKALAAIGIQPNDVVTICMPNCPQAIDTFYALDRMGAVANMVHPLSAQGEITFYLNCSKSKAILTLDQFCSKVVAARAECDHTVIIIQAQIADELSMPLSAILRLQNRRQFGKPHREFYTINWTDMLEMGRKFPKPVPEAQFQIDRTSVILYSGGTTGTTKGIMLSDLNFNALSLQSEVAMETPLGPGMRMLSVMPVFHGFGLGIGIHTCISHGVDCILIPRFSVKNYAHDLKKYKPNYIAGVPTLYEALLRTKGLENADLSFLNGMFSGGDSLSIELKKKVDTFLKSHHASIQVREGYGTTECVTASCLTPKDDYRPGSIGLPYPDTYYCITKPGTCETLPVGEEGEICLTGPTVMLGYLNNKEETDETLRIHEDGLTWLHTGDLGLMDADGFVYFKQRIKRMIVVSGYNVYPSQIENILDGHPKVLISCAIGVDDPYRIQHVKAFVVLKPGIVGDEAVKTEIMDYCAKHISRYAMPRELEFRTELPKTLVGKVAYRVLEAEEKQRSEQEKQTAEAIALKQKQLEQAQADKEAAEKQQRAEEKQRMMAQRQATRNAAAKKNQEKK